MELTLASLVNEALPGSGCLRRQLQAWPLASTFRAIMTGLAAYFLDQMNAFDANAALHRLDHVVDRKTSDRHRRQRFHLDAGWAGDLDGGADDAAGQFFVGRDVERDLRQRQRMAKRYQVRSALRRHDAGDTG